MWRFKDREGSEDTRPIIEPEYICEHAVNADVTDICFLDEHNIVTSLQNGGVVLLKYQSSAKVFTCTLKTPLPNV